MTRGISPLTTRNKTTRVTIKRNLKNSAHLVHFTAPKRASGFRTPVSIKITLLIVFIVYNSPVIIKS